MVKWGVLKHVLPLWTALVFSGPAQAQDWATRAVCEVDQLLDAPEAQSALAPDQVMDRAAEISNGTGRFWRITAPNGAVSHLWGTFHSANRFILDLPDPVIAAITSAQVVALEIDPVFESRDAYRRAIAQPGYLRPSNTGFRFEDLGLPDQIETWVGDRLEAIGWGYAALDYLSLGGLAELLLWSPCDDFDNGVIPNQDSYIQTLARIENIPVKGLEPRNRLIRHLNHPNNHDLARAMIAVYGSYFEPVDSSATIAAHVTLYVQGKIAVSMVMDKVEAEQALGDEGQALYELLHAYLLDERNHGFLASAEKELQQGGLFMGVGAYHLPGEQGVVALLREQGYVVERIPLPGEALK